MKNRPVSSIRSLQSRRQFHSPTFSRNRREVGHSASSVGADVVVESSTLIDLPMSEFAMFQQLPPSPCLSGTASARSP